MRLKRPKNVYRVYIIKMDIHAENKENGETNVSIKFEEPIQEIKTEKPENKGIIS